MQDRSDLNDPHLEALARQLAAARPRLGALERDALLYECGFAAGRQAAAHIVQRWRAVAASLALVAAGLGVISSGSRVSPQIAKVVSRAESVVVESAAPGRPHAEIPDDTPRHDRPRPGVLLANSSWEQVRASLESSPREVEVFSVPAAPSRRTVLSAGSAWNEIGLSR